MRREKNFPDKYDDTTYNTSCITPVNPSEWKNLRKSVTDNIKPVFISVIFTAA